MMRTHSVPVTRLVTLPTDSQGQIKKGQVDVTDALACLIEPLKGKLREDITSRFPEARFLVTIPIEGNPELKPADVIVWKGRKFSLLEIEEDDSRPASSSIEPYWVGYLKQVI